MSTTVIHKHDPQYLEELRECLVEQRRAFQQAVRKATSDCDGLVARSCPLCIASQAQALFPTPEGELPYVRCSACGLVFMSPVLPEARNGSYLGFDDSSPVMRRYWGLRRQNMSAVPKPNPEADPQLKDIVRHKRGGRLLDVGCGLGEFLKKASYFFEVEGVELNPRLRQAALANGLAIPCARVEELPTDRAYDVVGLNQVLYGLYDPVGLLKEIQRRLKRDGIVYINTPNADSFAVRIFGRAHSHFLCTNLNVFNLPSLERLADQAGLRVITWRTEWLDIYPGDLLAQWLAPQRFFHRRNSFVSLYGQINALVDWMDRRWVDPWLGLRGDYLVAILANR